MTCLWQKKLKGVFLYIDKNALFDVVEVILRQVKLNSLSRTESQWTTCDQNHHKLSK